jgi:archaeosine-15-forming tRNA-guanine transglycosylase
MANYATRFITADYAVPYTSNIIYGNDSNSSNQTRGVIQVSLTSGEVSLQMRLTDEAPWVTAKTYTASTLEEVVLAPQMRVVATGAAECWLAETR